MANGNPEFATSGKTLEMTDRLTLTEIADALDTLADIMVSDGMEELAGCNASFWRDAALRLRRVANNEPLEKADPKLSQTYFWG